jgi:hypothetical protein
LGNKGLSPTAQRANRPHRVVVEDDGVHSDEGVGVGQRIGQVADPDAADAGVVQIQDLECAVRRAGAFEGRKRRSLWHGQS